MTASQGSLSVLYLALCNVALNKGLRSLATVMEQALKDIEQACEQSGGDVAPHALATEALSAEADMVAGLHTSSTPPTSCVISSTAASPRGRGSDAESNRAIYQHLSARGRTSAGDSICLVYALSPASNQPHLAAQRTSVSTRAGQWPRRDSPTWLHWTSDSFLHTPPVHWPLRN